MPRDPASASGSAFQVSSEASSLVVNLTSSHEQLTTKTFYAPAPKEEENSFAPPINLPRFIVLCFFLTCGGPGGIEDIVGAAGPAPALLGLVILPLLYSVPQALMTAELSSLMSENGGYIIWVQRAFGDFVGWVNSYNSMFCNFFDNATYPALFVSYLVSKDFPWIARYSFQLAFVLLGMVLNVVGIEIVSLVSFIMTCLILLPFIYMFIVRIPYIEPSSQWTVIADDPHWGLYFGTLIWAFTGWDGLGAIAGEVKNPGRTYPLGVLCGVVLIMLTFLVPVVTALTFSLDLHHWQEGYFEVVAKDMGTWLGWLVMLGALLSNFGVFTANLAEASRAVWAMGRDTWGTRQLPSIFGSSSTRFNTPVFSILVNCAITAGLLLFDFTTLVQADSLLNCITLLIEFAAFLWIKHKEPNVNRPFAVPGGKVGAWVISIPKFLIIGLAMALSEKRTLIVVAGINVVIVLLFFVHRVIKQYFLSQPVSYQVV